MKKIQTSEERDEPEGDEESQDEGQQNQQQEDQRDDSGDDNPSPTLKDDRRFEVFGDHPDETSCELSKKSFESLICKVLPDTAEFPEDIFNIEGCIWCGSREHDIYSCLGYATWLGDIWLGPIEERRISYPQRQKRIEQMLKEARNQHYNPRRP